MASVVSMQDRTLVARICAPFINDEMKTEAFCFTLLCQTIVPQLVQRIKEIDVVSFRSVPQMAKLAVDNFGKNGLDLILDSVFPEILQGYRSASVKYAPVYAQLYLETLSVLPGVFRDDLCVAHIKTFAASESCKDRSLAAHLIPIVENYEQILSQFRSLAIDGVPSVRASVVASLARCKFDEDLIFYVLKNACVDQDQAVKECAARVFATVFPRKVSDFEALISDESIGRVAICGVSTISKCNGCESVVKIFQVIAAKYPDDAAKALLDMASSHDDNDEPFLINFARLLIKNTAFMWHLHEFSTYFAQKQQFLDFLDPSKVRDWRLRFVLEKQTELFIPELGSQLLAYALRYSGDLNATIRNGVIMIWKALLQLDDPAVRDKFEWLSTKGYRQRLIVAKTLSQIDIEPRFIEIATRISKDPVINVRFCLARGIFGSPLFQKLFCNSQDQEILNLTC